MAGVISGCDSAAPSDPDPSPPGGPGHPLPAATLYDRIIFTRRTPVGCLETCTYALWTMSMDGTDLRRLRDSLHYPESPSVAPDGRTVVFEDSASLFLIDAAGESLRHIETGLFNNYTPLWTPDGAWIVFQGSDAPDGLWQIYRIRPTGSGFDRLTAAEGLGAFSPALSRDGRYLAYVAYVPATYPFQAWVVIRDLADGGERVVSDSGFAGIAGSWSPDASGLLFLDADPATQIDWALWQLTVATGEYSYFGDSHGNRPATYSPDGQTLLFGTGDLWLADSSGQNPRVLLSDGALNFEAFWTPAAPSRTASTH